MEVNDSVNEVNEDNVNGENNILVNDMAQKRAFTNKVEFNCKKDATNDKCSGMVLCATQELFHA